MSNIYYKTVKGRKYAYRCLRSWRDADGKTHKQEKYLGAVEPVDRTPIMQQLHATVQQGIIEQHQAHKISIKTIQNVVQHITDTRPSASTVYNFLRENR